MRSTAVKMLRTPLLIINHKNYVEASGPRAISLAKAAEAVVKDLGVEIAIVPPIPDLSMVAKSVDIPVFSQHVDLAPPGSTTGAIVPEVVQLSGGKGTLLSHSERRVPLPLIRRTLPRIRSLGLCSVVCARTPREAKARAVLSPDFVAIEPPELIGTGRAVSKVRPEVIVDSVKAVKEAGSSTQLICGAGITSSEDVKKAIELGSVGILVASSVVKAASWEEKVKELAEPLISTKAKVGL